ncbi:MAG: MOSC domain-containing protein [Ornithinimicrobium sp.]|uniref:MOSC domain-containing protein n=1 Tax=Ornithinimicrobium sp. TaxID=1977084 RepID=UPI003D9B6C3D
MIAAHIRSVNAGPVVDAAHAGIGRSAIDKRPVGTAELRAPGSKSGGLGSGVVGDGIADRRDHGGDTQAVYAVAREELDHWAGVLGRDLPDGMFGENLTTSGLAVDDAVIGSRWQVGDTVVLRVCGPRIPCRTFAGHMGEARWVKRFTDRGRSGAYLAVQTPGEVRAGNEVVVSGAPGHGIDVRTTFRAFMGDLDAARAVLDAECLDRAHHAELSDLVARRLKASG